MIPLNLPMKSSSMIKKIKFSFISKTLKKSPPFQKKKLFPSKIILKFQTHSAHLIMTLIAFPAPVFAVSKALTVSSSWNRWVIKGFTLTRPEATISMALG